MMLGKVMEKWFGQMDLYIEVIGSKVYNMGLEL